MRNKKLIKKIIVPVLFLTLAFGACGSENDNEPAENIPVYITATPTPTVTPTIETTPTPTSAPVVTLVPTEEPVIKKGDPRDAAEADALPIMVNDIGPDENGKYKRADVSSLKTDASVDVFYKDALFTGDSVLNFLYWYVYSEEKDWATNSRWFSANSYSLNAAVQSVEDAVHPTFAGVERRVPDMVTFRNVKKIFMFFGLNDEIFGVDTLISNYEKLTAEIEEVQPGIEIYIISLTPVYKDAEGKMLNNEHVRETNARLIEMCKERGYGFIDVASYQIDEDGTLPAEYCSKEYDVHQNYTGYDIWMKVLRDYAACAIEKAEAQENVQ